MGWQKWSFNDRIRVKLKHQGRIVLLRHHMEERLRMLEDVRGSDAAYRMVLHQQHPQSNEGWFEFQMHRFIDIFGPTMSDPNSPMMQEVLFDDIEIYG